MAIRFDRLSLLQTFLRIAERGSLSAAARDLGTSQPSVSRQLAALENRLGTTLARRTTHELTLTNDGKALLVDARRLLAGWDAIEERTAEDGHLRGPIDVVAPVALGQGVFAKGAATFLAKHPHVTLNWRLTDDPIRFAEEGCDCWIKVGPVPDDTLVVRKLAEVERLVVGKPELAGGDELNLKPWLALGPYEGGHIRLFDADRIETSFFATPRMASDNIFALREAVLAGIGIAILPRWFVADALSDGRVVDIAPGLRADTLPVNLAMVPSAGRPLRVTRFADTIGDAVR